MELLHRLDWEGKGPYGAWAREVRKHRMSYYYRERERERSRNRNEKKKIHTTYFRIIQD